MDNVKKHWDKPTVTSLTNAMESAVGTAPQNIEDNSYNPSGVVEP